MNAIGHGATGLLDAQRIYYDLQQDAGASRQSYVDLVMGKAITKDGTHSGSIYYTDLDVDTDLTWAGRVRPIVSLQAMKLPRALTRVETLAAVAAGTWFCEDALAAPGGTIRLYFWLIDSDDPGTSELVMHLLFTFATAAESHPLLGAEIAADPLFRVWPTSSTLTYWTGTNVGATGVAIAQSTDLAPGIRGSFSAKISPGASGLASGGSGGLFIDNVVLSGGRHYWYTIYYLTPADMPAGLSASIRIRGAGGAFLLRDGILTQASPNDIPLRPTYGAIRRATFVFRGPADTTIGSFHVRLINTSGGAITTGYVQYWMASVKPSYRYLAYDALLAEDSLPDLEIRAASIDFGPKSLGGGDLTLMDPGDNSLVTAFGALLPHRKPVSVFVGGQFSGGKDEIHRSDWRGRFTGLTQRISSKPYEGKISIQLEDTRTLAYAQAAAAAYRPEDLTNMNVKDGGTTKALLFGDATEATFKGVRVDLDSNGYGYYQVVDDTVPVRDGVNVGLPDGWAPKVYPNEELAQKGEGGYELSAAITGNTAANPTVVTTAVRHGLATSQDVTISGSNSTPTINGRRTVTVISASTFSVAVNVSGAGTAGKVVSHADVDYSNNQTRFHVLRDIRDHGTDAAGNPIGIDFVIDFVYGAATLATAAIDISGDPAWRAAAKIQAAMVAAGGTLVTVSYDEGGGGNPHHWTIARTGVGALQLLTKTGANAFTKVYKTVMGFDLSANHTGATSYTSEDATFTSADKNHVIRWHGGGVHDDAAGSICGTADAPINNPPAVNSWLLRKVLNVPASRIDSLSFVAARTVSLSGDFAQLLLYVREPGSVLELLARMDRVGIMDTVIDGEGIIRCQRHSDSGPTRRSFYDRDYIDFEMWTDLESIYRTVRLWGGYDASIDKMTTYGDGTGVEDPALEIKYGAVETYEVQAGLDRSVIKGGLQLSGNILTRLFKQVPPLVQFTALGKLADLLVGDRIELTAERAMTSSGALDAVPFRIIGVKTNQRTCMGSCLAVQDVTIHS